MKRFLILISIIFIIFPSIIIAQNRFDFVLSIGLPKYLGEFSTYERNFLENWGASEWSVGLRYRNKNFCDKFFGLFLDSSSKTKEILNSKLSFELKYQKLSIKYGIGDRHDLADKYNIMNDNRIDADKYSFSLLFSPVGCFPTRDKQLDEEIERKDFYQLILRFGLGNVNFIAKPYQGSDYYRDNLWCLNLGAIIALNFDKNISMNLDAEFNSLMGDAADSLDGVTVKNSLNDAFLTIGLSFVFKIFSDPTY
jgi:hypothetical protein